MSAPPSSGGSFFASGDALGRVLRLAKDLIAFDTVSDKSNLPLTDYVEAYLRSLNVPYARALNASGDKAALFATIGPMTDGGVVLSGHTDVVPVVGQAWSRDPFDAWIANERLYGRGSTDMKGFDAVCLAMIPEFQAARLTRPIHILLSYDEEVSCLGSLDVIRRFGANLPQPSAVFVGEPTRMRVSDAHKSVSTYRTQVRGYERHSSQIRDGVSAIHVGASLICDLLRIGESFAQGPLMDRFDPPFSTVHVGMIAGGTARNIMARDCVFHWEFRGLPDAPLRAAYDRFQDLCAATSAEKFIGFDDCFIQTEIEVEIPGLAPQPGSYAETLALKLARANRTIAVPYASEAGQFQTHGVSTVVCGPGDIAQAHQPDEFIELEQFRLCIEFMRHLAAELR